MSTPETMLDLLRSGGAVNGSSPALVMSDSGEELTYAELMARVDTAAAALQAAGFRRGDSIAMWLPNCFEWVVLEFAAAGLGILVVPLNPRYKPGEVAHLLKVGRADGLVFMPSFHGIDFASMVEQVFENADPEVLSRLRLVVTVNGVVPAGFGSRGIRVAGYEDLMASGASATATFHGQPDDLVNVFGTSGTTSFPKLASHDQKTTVRHVRNASRALRLGPDERMLCFLPFCGTLGFVVLMSTLVAGGCAVVQAVYTHDGAVRAVRSRDITFLVSSEPILRGMFAAEEAGPDAFRTWKRGVVSSFAIRDLVDRAESEWGIALVNAYGSSEIWALAGTWDTAEPPEIRSIPGGRLVSDDMYVRAADPQTGEPVPDGELGELQFSGFNLTRGYLSNDEANAKAFTADGWYRSGDRGRVLEGGRAFEFQSRLADTLRLRGYLVNPVEIEEFLMTHPAVEEAQVVGVPVEGSGEDRAVAFVRVVDGATLDGEEARQYCRANLAGWKVPDVVEIVDSYPLIYSANATKVQKTKLREMAAELLSVSKG